MESPERSKLRSRGTTSEAFKRNTMVRESERGRSVSIPIAVLAENEIVGGAANRNRMGRTVIADLRAGVLLREKICRVNVLIAEQTELSRISSAI